LLHRIVMKIDPLIGPANDHDDHVGLGVKQLFVADRRLEELLVLGDPALEVEWLETRVLEHGLSFRAFYSAATLAAAFKVRPHPSKAARVADFSASLSSSSGRRTGPPTWPSSSCQYF